MSDVEALDLESRQRAARKTIADIRRSSPGSSHGRTKINLIGLEDNIGLPHELEEAARRDGSQRRLTSAQRRKNAISHVIPQTEQREQYALPTLDAASWCPLDRGRLTARKVIQEATWANDLPLSIRRMAVGVWVLKPTTTGRGLVHVDSSGRRIFLTTEWVRANKLMEAKGLLACATKRGVIIVDVRRAHFDKLDS